MRSRVADNSIKDSGATALGAVIGELKHLEHLDISCVYLMLT